MTIYTGTPETDSGLPTSRDLITLIQHWCEAYTNAHIGYALADHTRIPADHATHTASAADWERQARDRFAVLAAALEHAPHWGAQAETFMPIRTRGNGHVDLHARDQDGRPVVVTMTFVEAVSIGTHLTAHAAVGADRTGVRIDRVLPRLPSEAGAALMADSPAADPDGTTRGAGPAPAAPVPLRHRYPRD